MSTYGLYMELHFSFDPLVVVETNTFEGQNVTSYLQLTLSCNTRKNIQIMIKNDNLNTRVNGCCPKPLLQYSNRNVQLWQMWEDHNNLTLVSFYSRILCKPLTEKNAVWQNFCSNMTAQILERLLLLLLWCVSLVKIILSKLLITTFHVWLLFNYYFSSPTSLFKSKRFFFTIRWRTYAPQY